MGNGGFDGLIRIIIIIVSISLLAGPITFGLSFIKLIPNFVIYILSILVLMIGVFWINTLIKDGFNKAYMFFAVESVIFGLLTIYMRIRK